MLQVAKDHSARDWAMILVGYLHGLRVSEITALTDKDVQDGYIKVNRLKGSLSTVQKLVQSEDPLFNEYQMFTNLVHVQKMNGRLFPITRQRFWKIIKMHGKKAGLPEHLVHPHILKHSVAHNALDNGMPINELQQYLGHKSLNSTAAYLRSSDQSACNAFAKAMGA